MLTGRGLSTLAMEPPDEQGVFRFVGLSYDFEPAEPIPEPGTLLLVGAAGLALIRRPGKIMVEP